MLGKGWTGTTDDILDAISQAGYEGVEITDRMIGAYADRPGDFADALAVRGLTLVSVAFGSASGFTLHEEIEADLECARRWIAFAATFPGACVSIGSGTEVSPGPRGPKFDIAAEICNRAGELGRQAGVAVAVHPSSHHATLLFDRADYDQFFARLDASLVAWVPDTGHLLRGHPDMLDTLRTYRDRVLYLHLKDADASGDWAMLGEGVCDTAAVLAIVRASPRFNGWLVLEEESSLAAADPGHAVQANRKTLRALGI